jgi:isopenicillin N synthase-like dioxygenase
MSNGKYRSVVHRAFVNEKATRISIATVYGPSLDTVVGPVPELVHRETNPAAYTEMEYKEYLRLQQSNQLDGKSCLDHVRISPA